MDWFVDEQGTDILELGRVSLIVLAQVHYRTRRSKRQEYRYIVMIGRPKNFGMSVGGKRWDYLGVDGIVYRDKTERNMFATRREAMNAAEEFAATEMTQVAR